MKRYEPRPVEPVSRPLDIRHIDGEIVVIGPGSVAFSMTLEAARGTCERLRQTLESFAREGPSGRPAPAE